MTTGANLRIWCVGICLLSGIHTLAQEPGEPTVVVTSGGRDSRATGRQWTQPRIFRRDPTTKSYSLAWQGAVLDLEPDTALAWRRESVLSLSPAMTIADWDNDGNSDLLLIDQLGLTVYGRHPAYLPFLQATPGTVSLLLEDLDRDGRMEMVIQRSGNGGREIEVWRRDATKFVLLSTQTFVGSSYVLQMGDVDNDGVRELVTASDTILILKPEPQYRWRVAAELPNIGLPPRPGQTSDFTLVDVVRVADVDRDGRNEVVATGNSGMVTVYKHRVQPSGREGYPVLWQSPYLAHPDLQPRAGNLPFSLTQGLAVADLDADGHLEILVGTLESGRPPQGVTLMSHLYLYSFDGVRGFTRTWTSPWTTSSGIPGFAVGDLDGDRRLEFVHNGQDVYSFDATTQSFRSEPLCSTCGFASAVVGTLGALSEPTTAVRIVPVRAQFAGGRLVSGQPTQLTLTFRSVWAEAKNVRVTVKSADGAATVSGGTVALATIPGGGVATLSPVTVTATRLKSQSDDDSFVRFEIELVADGGYKQTISFGKFVSSAAGQ